MRRMCVPFAVVTALALAGCGGDSKQVAVDEVRKTELTELGDLLKMLAGEGKRPPARLADLAELEPFLPTAGAGLRNGEIVYLWGAGFVDGGTAVVAYEKKAPAEGGWVLLQNGTTKTMTADEFKAAPKAK